MLCGPLYLLVNGDQGGYVELKVDPNSGALCGLVVVDLPLYVERAVVPAEVLAGSNVPVLDLDIWEWKVTPDYKEPLKNHADDVSPLAHSHPDGALLLFPWVHDPCN
jgi:hypothetical protein